MDARSIRKAGFASDPEVSGRQVHPQSTLCVCVCLARRIGRACMSRS